MPPRYAYWTILAGGLPTAFRAADRDELLPTFKRIHEKHPDAEMKYFARGKLWTSPDEARQAAARRREMRTSRPPRGPDWRPGGDHRDPRQTFGDAKKTRNLRWRKQRSERRRGSKPFVPASTAQPPVEKPHGDPLRKHVKPRRPRPHRGPRHGRPSGPRPPRRGRGRS